jgi:hypothetical protein
MVLARLQQDSFSGCFIGRSRSRSVSTIDSTNLAIPSVCMESAWDVNMTSFAHFGFQCTPLSGATSTSKSFHFSTQWQLLLSNCSLQRHTIGCSYRFARHEPVVSRLHSALSRWTLSCESHKSPQTLSAPCFSRFYISHDMCQMTRLSTITLDM